MFHAKHSHEHTGLTTCYQKYTLRGSLVMTWKGYRLKWWVARRLPTLRIMYSLRLFGQRDVVDGGVTGDVEAAQGGEADPGEVGQA